MTPLIDIIFLLLLFFMLSSTFSKFSELEISAGGAGDGVTEDVRPAFLKLEQEMVSLNGRDARIDALPGLLKAMAGEASVLPVLVSLGPEVDAQRLTDLLVALRRLEGITVTVLGSA